MLAAARIPAEAATHGPIQLRVNGGGRRTARRPPAANRPPRSPSATRIHVLGAGRQTRRASHRAAPAAAATPARIDHRTVRPHAPNGSAPIPNRLQGSTVAARPRANANPVTTPNADEGRRTRMASSGTASGPSAAERHSAPKTRPRTGVAHVRQRGRPQESHRATETLPGCRSHRSRFFVLRSSVGTLEAYRRVAGSSPSATRSARSRSMLVKSAARNPHRSAAVRFTSRSSTNSVRSARSPKRDSTSP